MKKSINYRTFAYAFLIAMILFGCETKNATIQTTDIIINGRGLEIFVIDSCQYIGRINGASTDVLAHKGNCKFCAERSKIKANNN